MITHNFEQGSESWLRARIGACTASRFRDARERVGGLNEQQATYVKALQAGATEAAARLAAGYKNAPRAGVIDRALAGQPVDEPGSKAIAYAAMIAVETIANEPLDETFVTYAMRRGRELEPYGRQKYEARLQCNKVMKTVGLFDCPVAASAAYQGARKEAFGDYA